MKTYTNYVFVDGNSTVVLERLAGPVEQVFGPLADGLNRIALSQRVGANIATLVAFLIGSEGEFSLSDRVVRNDRHILVVDLRNNSIALHNAVEAEIGDQRFSMTIAAFVDKYGAL